MRLFYYDQELPTSPTICIEEGQYYRLVFSLQNLPSKVLWGMRELTWSDTHGGFLLETSFEAGMTTLQVIFSDHEKTFPIQVKPNPEKLSAEDWATMLEEIEQGLPGGAVGISQGTQGTIGKDGTLLPILTAALLPLVPAFIRSIEEILKNPRVLVVRELEEVRLHTVRRADRETLRWVAQHPTAVSALDAWNVARLGHTDPFLPQRRPQETLAHPANAYLLWLLLRVKEKLQTLSTYLERASRRSDATEAAREWCKSRAASLANSAWLLERTQRRSFFRGLVAAPPSEAALLVVQDEPNYARAHNLGRRLLSPRFQLPSDPESIGAPLKPTYSLYELWCFLEVQRQLQKNLPEHQWSWSKDAEEKLLVGSGHGVSLTGQHPNGEVLTLWFNLTFPSWHSHKKSRYSLSLERRPDLVLTRKQGEEASWMFFDAKYRVGRRSLGESFESVHIYRDSLRWEEFGGLARGGLLLSPKEHPDSADWFKKEFREKFQIGATMLTPGKENTSLASWVLGILR